MTDVERVNEAFRELFAAFAEATEAVAEIVSEFVKGLCDQVPHNILQIFAAYETASRERPEWVHKARYSKKKRTRKKYHDRIVRTYWRGC